MVTPIDVINEINRIRSGPNLQLNQLIISPTLMSLADAKAADHLLGGYPDPETVPGPCAHISPRLGSPLDQARSAGYCYYPFELWAGSTNSMIDPITVWLTSPCHNPWITGAFMIDPSCGLNNQSDVTNARMSFENLTHIGVGYRFNPATNGDEWVLILANERQAYTSSFDPYRASCPPALRLQPPIVPVPASCLTPTCQTGWRQENNSWAYYQLVNNQCVRQTGWVFDNETNAMKQALRIGAFGATHNWFYIDPNTGVWSGWVWNGAENAWWYYFLNTGVWWRQQCDANGNNCQDWQQQSAGPML